MVKEKKREDKRRQDKTRNEARQGKTRRDEKRHNTAKAQQILKDKYQTSTRQKTKGKIPNLNQTRKTKPQTAKTKDHGQKSREY